MRVLACPHHHPTRLCRWREQWLRSRLQKNIATQIDHEEAVLIGGFSKETEDKRFTTKNRSVDAP